MLYTVCRSQLDSSGPGYFHVINFHFLRKDVHRGLKLNRTHSFLVYADVHILGGSVYRIKKHVEALPVAMKEIGLELNADKSKYMVMSRDQNEGRSHNIKIDNCSFERVEEFKYLGKILT